MSSEDLANRLHSLAIHLLRRVRQEDVHTGLGPARLSALSVVGFAGPCTVSELAASEQVSIPTISKIVAALVAEGLVERLPDEHDRRVVRLMVTDRGMDTLQNGRLRRISQIAALLNQLSAEELEAVRVAVPAIERTLQE